jgi:hypothetical protein
MTFHVLISNKLRDLSVRNNKEYRIKRPFKASQKDKIIKSAVPFRTNNNRNRSLRLIQMFN